MLTRLNQSLLNVRMSHKSVTNLASRARLEFEPIRQFKLASQILILIDFIPRRGTTAFLERIDPRTTVLVAPLICIDTIYNY